MKNTNNLQKMAIVLSLTFSVNLIYFNNQAKAAAIGENIAVSTSLIEASSLNKKMEILPTFHKKTEKPTLLAQSDSHYIRDHDGSACVKMPGEIISNDSDGIMSVNDFTETAYFITHEDVSVTPPQDRLYGVLDEVVYSWSQKRKITIISKIFLQVDGAPAGVEFTGLEDDGKKSKTQIILRDNRIYIIYAITAGELGIEADDFFNSFEIY